MRVRPFRESDTPEVATLHRRVFTMTGGRDAGPPEAHHRFLTAVFLSGPAHEADLPSLVYEGQDGRVRGFLGVTTRRMTMGVRPVRAALASQLFVDPEHRKHGAGRALLEAFFAGPQDLSVGDSANDASRKLWEALGGRTALFQSLHWIRVLRPARLAVGALRRRPGLRALAALPMPLAPAMDAVLARLPGSPLRPPPVHLAEERLEAESLVREAPGLLRGRPLAPSYDVALVEWIFLRAEKEQDLGRLERVLVRSREGRPLGWHVSYVRRGGLSEVLQVMASQATVGSVLDDLFRRAWQGGATAVSGRLDPEFVQPLSDRFCLLHRRAPWVLVHSRSPEVLSAATASGAFLSRLDGEWGIWFRRHGEIEARPAVEPEPLPDL